MEASDSLGLSLTIHLELFDKMLLGEVVSLPLLGKREIRELRSCIERDHIVSEIQFGLPALRSVHLRFIPQWLGTHLAFRQLKIDQVKTDGLFKAGFSSQLVLKPLAVQLEKALNRDLKSKWHRFFESQFQQIQSALPIKKFEREDIEILLRPPAHISLTWPFREKKVGSMPLSGDD